MRYLKLFSLFLLLLPAGSFAQGPFFTHFYGNEARFNPALTGQLGALSISLKAKQQWRAEEADGYETYQLTLEESMPCSFFDYGFSVMQDTEGAGRLRTQQFGGMLAAPLILPLGGFKDLALLRIGIGLHWGQQSIDYSRLLFIDQIDPKYGLVDADGQPIPTAFVPPNAGLSNWYFQPSGGLAFRYIFNTSNPETWNIDAALAMHNLVPWAGANGRGHSWSVLGLGTPTIPRFTLLLGAGGIVSEFGNNYFSVHPRLFAQTQRGIAYLEAGSDFSFSRLFSVGAYLHSSRPYEGQASTNWGSVQLEAGFFPSTTTRMDVGLGYSYNFSGLRNLVGNIFELTLRFSFQDSPACRLAGDPDPYNRSPGIGCPRFRRNSGGNKIYENIWYKNN